MRSCNYCGNQFTPEEVLGAPSKYCDERKGPPQPGWKVFLETFAFIVVFLALLSVTAYYFFSPFFTKHLDDSEKFMDDNWKRQEICVDNLTTVGIETEVVKKDDGNPLPYANLFRIRRGVKHTNDSSSLEDLEPNDFQVTTTPRDGRSPSLIRIRRRVANALGFLHMAKRVSRVANAWGFLDMAKRVRRGVKHTNDSSSLEDLEPNHFKGVFMLHPVTTTPRDGRSPRLIRIRRQDSKQDEDSFESSDSSSCKLPSGGLKTAEILCKMWPRTTTCVSYCAYGKTYDEGIRRIHTCVHGEGMWSKEFEECKPFVDCKLRLIAPGNLQCIGNKLNENPVCKVSCDRYEDQEEVKGQIYRCKSDGSWEPELPFCVALQGMPLVRAPEMIEHDEIDYPKAPRKRVQN